MSKITNAQLLEAINNINNNINSLSKRVEALEGKSKPTATNKGKGVAKLFSVELKDYEPKKDESGNYIWQSYKKNRTRFCYSVATNGKAYGCYDKDGNKVADFNEIKGEYEKAKAKFEKKFKYIKKADR